MRKNTSRKEPPLRYQIPESRWVALKVYDVLGQEVATLVDEVKQPGAYTVRWDASWFARGMYFYRLSAVSFSSVRKTLVIK